MMDQQQQSDRCVEIQDSLHALLLQEERSYRCSDTYYCASKPIVFVDHPQDCDAPPKNNIIKVQSLTSISDVRDVAVEDEPEGQQLNEEHCFWRQQMFDWSVTVLDSFGIDREASAVAFNLLDRFLAAESSKGGPEITRDDYQLYSMVCLYIAVKINEPYPRKLSVQVLVDMSKDFYSKEVIESTEREVLEGLNWRLATPTAVSYVRLFQDLLAPSSAPFPSTTRYHLQATAYTLTELAVGDAFFVSYPNSCVGLAALLLAANLEPTIDESQVHDFLLHTQSVVDTETSEFRAVYRQLEKLSHH